MTVLLDLNVVLDVLLARAPWNVAASAVWNAHRSGLITAHFAAASIPTVFYVVRRHASLALAHDAVRVCLETLSIAPVVKSTLELARTFPGSDYEDNLQIAVAVECGSNAIVTRDPAGFAGSPLPVMTPEDLVATLPGGTGTTP